MKQALSVCAKLSLAWALALSGLVQGEGRPKAPEKPKEGSAIETIRKNPEYFKRQTELEKAKKVKEAATGGKTVVPGFATTGGKAKGGTAADIKAEGKGSHEGAVDMFGGKRAEFKESGGITTLAQLAEFRSQIKDPELLEILKKDHETTGKSLEEKGEEDSLLGYLERERMLINNLLGRKELGRKEAKALNKQILAKLKGQGKEKDITKEDLESLAMLTCPAKCGNKATAPACRLVSRFMLAAEAAGILTSAAACSAAWLAFTADSAVASTDGTEEFSYPFKDAEGKDSTLKVAQLDVPVDDEMPKAEK